MKILPSSMKTLPIATQNHPRRLFGWLKGQRIGHDRLKRFSLPLLLALGPFVLFGPAPAADLQLHCAGTLLEARGSAERQRPVIRIAFSLSLEAEDPIAEGALGRLQARLAAVRSKLMQLGVEDLQVGSPATWKRPAEAPKPAAVQASLSVSGRLAAGQLQGLIRRVGSLPGVRLAPVTAEADPAAAEVSRQLLLAAAYRDAEAQVRPLALLIGRPQLIPLQIQLEGGGPVMARFAGAAAAPPPFSAAELPPPTDRLGLQVQFCAVPHRR